MFRDLARRSRRRPRSPLNNFEGASADHVENGDSAPTTSRDNTDEDDVKRRHVYPPRSSSFVRRLSSAGGTPRRSLSKGLSFSLRRRRSQQDPFNSIQDGSNDVRQEPSKAPEQQKKPETQPESVPKTTRKEVGVAAPLTSARDLLAWKPKGEETRVVGRVKLGEYVLKKYRRGTSNTSSMAVGGGIPRGPGSTDLRSLSAVNRRLGDTRRGSSTMKRIQPPRLMVVHDFGGGYPRAEAKAGGVSGKECAPDSKLYRFNHWAYVDIFVYFEVIHMLILWLSVYLTTNQNSMKLID